MGMMDEGRWTDNVPSIPSRNRPVRRAPEVESPDSTQRLNRVIGNVRRSPLVTAEARNEIIDTILDRRLAS